VRHAAQRHTAATDNMPMISTVNQLDQQEYAQG